MAKNIPVCHPNPPGKMDQPFSHRSDCFPFASGYGIFIFSANFYAFAFPWRWISYEDVSGVSAWFHYSNYRNTFCGGISSFERSSGILCGQRFCDALCDSKNGACAAYQPADDRKGDCRMQKKDSDGNGGHCRPADCSDAGWMPKISVDCVCDAFRCSASDDCRKMGLQKADSFSVG